MKKILNKENVLSIIFLLFCFSLFLFDFLKTEHYMSTYIIFGIVSIVVVILIFLFFKKFKTIKKENYHKFYIVLVMVIGILYIFLAPIYMGSDERSHFYRVYEITEGHLITSADKVGRLTVMPRSLNKAYNGYDDENKVFKGTITYKDSINKIKIPLDKENKLIYCACNDTNYFGVSLYSPFQYIPQLIGVSIGKLFNLGPWFLIMLARLFNLIFFGIITTIGVKLLPKFKLPMILILLSPVVLSGATTVSADGITNAYIFVFIAYIANIIFNKLLVTTKDKVILSILVFLIAMCKIVYFPIMALLFLIPNNLFKSKKEGNLFKIILFIFGLFCSFVWLYIASMFVDSQSTTSVVQKEFIFSHPISYIMMILKTYATYISEDLLNIFFGNQMYHWSLKVYPLFSILYLLVIIASFFTEKASLKLTKKSKIVVLFIIVIIIGLISTALFVQHNVSNSSVIGGIQARYFIPLCLLSILVIDIKKKRYSDKIVFWLYILLLFPTVLTVLLRFI